MDGEIVYGGGFVGWGCEGVEEEVGGGYDCYAAGLDEEAVDGDARVVVLGGFLGYVM